MSIAESFALALKNITSSKMRTFLTMLGIIIGVAAVTLITGLGNGLRDYIASEFADMGTDTLTVSIQARGATRTMSDEDIYDLVSENSQYFKYCSPSASVMGNVKIDSETLTSTSISGVSEDYLTNMKNMEFSQGRDLEYSDMVYRNKVCVIGAYLNQKYFSGSGLGQTLRIGGVSMTVVGVLSQTVDTLEEGCTDDCVYLPYTTAIRNGGTISSYNITVQDEDQVTAAKEVMESALTDYFGSSDYYTVTSMAEMLDSMNTMINALVAVLAGIAAISLIVGGIGIMNIMLVSVSERTREIGIRKSLGARESYIMQQFVIEAALTSALGGILGIVLGKLLSSLATVIINTLSDFSMTVTPTWASIALAFGISVGIGVLFGYLPAKKAARLNPIDALHAD
jgi:putative ABC transport system permease protein